jgi:hypothetical protein
MSDAEPNVDQAPDNPYAAPCVHPAPDRNEECGLSADDAALRRAHLKREAIVRGIGILVAFACLFPGFIAAAATISFVQYWTVGRDLPIADGPLQPYVRTGLLSAIFLVLSAVPILIGLGLRRFKPWARWASLALCGIVILVIIGNDVVTLRFPHRPLRFDDFLTPWAIVPAACLWFLASPTTSTLFTPAYRDVVARSPQIQPRLARRDRRRALIVLTLFLLLVLTLIRYLADGGGR